MKKKILGVLSIAALMTIAGCNGGESSEATPSSEETPASSQTEATSSEVSSTARYTVTFDAAGGSDVDEQVVSEGGKVTEPSDPTKVGKKFVGWYTADGEEWDFTTGVVTADITLTAHWELDPKPVIESIPVNDVNECSDASNSVAVWTNAGTVLHNASEEYGAATNNVWTSVYVVDADGRLMYGSYVPNNGYGQPDEWYLRHSKYADWTANPIFTIEEGFGPWSTEDQESYKNWTLTVPEGCFGITICSDEDYAARLSSALTRHEVDSIDSNGALNRAESMYTYAGTDQVRVGYNADKGTIEVYGPAEVQGTTLSEESDLPRVYKDGDDFSKENFAEGSYSVAIDGDGRVVFAGYTSDGYYGPNDDANFYTDGNYTPVAGTKSGIFDIAADYIPWGEDEGASGKFLNFDCFVPENGYIVTGSRDQMIDIVYCIFGENLKQYVETGLFAGLTKGAFNNMLVEATVEPGTITFAITDEPALVDEDAPVTASLNVRDAKLALAYDDSYEGTIKGTFGDYTFAIDGNGQIVYAGYSADGYGGPSDAFYNNGSYVAQAGTTHGIFALDADYLSWNDGGDATGAYNNYSVVVPEGGYIVTGGKAVMTAIFALGLGVDITDDDCGSVINEVAHGSRNSVVIKTAVAEGIVTFTAEAGEEEKAPVSYYSEAAASTTADSTLTIWAPGTVLHTDVPGQHLCTWCDCGGWDSVTGNGWRTYIVFDAEGKLCYYSHNPQNGYGGPKETSYGRHSDYNDYTKNPAISISDGFKDWSEEDGTSCNKWTLTVPEGGFGITAYDDADNGIVHCLAIFNALTGNTAAELTDGVANQIYAGVDNVRGSSVNGSFYLSKTLHEEAAASTTADSTLTIWAPGTVLHTDVPGQHLCTWCDCGGWDSVTGNGWRTYIVFDAEGKLCYYSHNPQNGYGGPKETSYGRHSDYNDYTKNPAISISDGFKDWSEEDGTSCNKWTLTVPEGGFAVTAYDDADNGVNHCLAIFNALTGNTAAELTDGVANQIYAGADNIRGVVENGVFKIMAA